MKVLIADDSGMLRHHLSKLISPIPGISRIDESHSLFSTLQQLQVEQPQVLILDLQLGDGSGFQVLEFLKSRENRPKVIVFTNFPSDHNRARCLKLGADMLLDKSFDHKRLVQVLREYAQSPESQNKGVDHVQES
ncbi:response regulator [Spirochaeta lutea]|uniref:Response regulatory domain-containing protein n=1 Tax=Spirochaeta lutea TaxID=1480694 RepID=A0A098QW00_9SPIO|nr:response regulator [Spirochaeta lutea]KGE72045.1 hypothetical protein DC28_08010 [Spirochaeta lutea]